MWGSSRFMSPEEFTLGATIDEVTNVYTLGAFAFYALGDETDRRYEKWQAEKGFFDIATKATSPDRALRLSIRFGSVVLELVGSQDNTAANDLTGDGALSLATKEALVGHLGASAVTSIGLSMAPLNVFYGVFTGLGVAATAIVARSIGADEEREATHVAAQAVLVSLLFAVLGAIGIILFARNLVIWMGAEPDVIVQGTRYLHGNDSGAFLHVDVHRAYRGPSWSRRHQVPYVGDGSGQLAHPPDPHLFPD